MFGGIFIFVVLEFALVYIGMYLGERLRRWLFPSGTFAVGDGVDRYNSLVRTRRVIGGAILTLVLGGVGFWLYPLLFQSPPPR